MSLDAYVEGEIRLAARRAGALETALLAIAEIEGRGRILVEIGGAPMPPIRYRPHVFFRRLRPENRAHAVAAGLAAPRAEPDPAPRTQRAQWALLARAQRVDRAAALAACEWGFGAAAGERAAAFGFESGEELAALACSGVAGQTRLLLRRLDAERIRPAVEAADWRRYAATRDAEPEALAARLSAAAARWAAAAPAEESEPTLGLGAESGAVLRLQRLLNGTGRRSPEDGVFGRATRAALLAAQAELGLVRDGLARPAVWEALREEVARARPRRCADLLAPPACSA